MTKKNVIPELPAELLKYVAVGVGLILLLIYAFFILKIDAKSVFIILGFILLGAVSRLPQRMSPFAFGVELVSLVIVVSAIKYSAWVGLFVGLTSVALSAFYTKERPQDVAVMLVGFVLIGYSAPFVYGVVGSLGMAALVLTLGYDLLTNAAYVFMGHPWMSCLRFSAIHIPSNYLIIKYLGMKMIGI